MASVHKSLMVTLSVGSLALLLSAVVYLVSLRQRAALNVCRGYLAGIDIGKRNWGLEYHKAGNEAPTWDDLIGERRLLRQVPVCPKRGTYIIGRLDELPRCSYHGTAGRKGKNDA
jgi:hypothetical protein